MLELIFIGGLLLSFLSLVGALFLGQWRETGQTRSAFEALRMVLVAVVGALLLMVPLFYLVYIGMIPRWGGNVAALVANILLPLGWAHLSVYASETGRTFWARYAPGIGLYLTLLVHFLGLWTWALLWFPYWILLADWLLLLGSLALWLRARHHQPHTPAITPEPAPSQHLDD